MLRAIITTVTSSASTLSKFQSTEPRDVDRKSSQIKLASLYPSKYHDENGRFLSKALYKITSKIHYPNISLAHLENHIMLAFEEISSKDPLSKATKKAKTTLLNKSRLVDICLLAQKAHPSNILS